MVPQRRDEQRAVRGLVDDERERSVHGWKIKVTSFPTLQIGYTPLAREVQQVAAAMGRDHAPTFVAGEVDGPRERPEDVRVQRRVRALDSQVDEPVRSEAVADAFPALLVPVLVEPVVGEVRRGLVRGILGEILREGPVLAVEQSFVAPIASRIVTPRVPVLGVLLESHLPSGQVGVQRGFAIHHEYLRVSEQLGHARYVRHALPGSIHLGPLIESLPTFTSDVRQQYRLVGSHEVLCELRGAEIRCVDPNDTFALRQRHHLGLDVRHGLKVGPAVGHDGSRRSLRTGVAIFLGPTL